MTFETKDSGQRQDFGNGSVRDTNEGKPRYDLISSHALKRIAELMARGASKYGERNWEKGQPRARFIESALRHLYQYIDGDRTEDHLAAVCFNTMAIMHFESTVEGYGNDKCFTIDNSDTCFCDCIESHVAEDDIDDDEFLDLLVNMTEEEVNEVVFAMMGDDDFTLEDVALFYCIAGGKNRPLD